MPDWQNSSYGRLNPDPAVSRKFLGYFSPAVLVKHARFGIERIRHKLAESHTVGGFRRAVGSVRVRMSEARGSEAEGAGAAGKDGDEPPFASLWPWAVGDDGALRCVKETGPLPFIPAQFLPNP